MAGGVAEHPAQRETRQRPCRRAMRISPPTSPCVPGNQAGSSLPRQSTLRFHRIGEQAVRFSIMARPWQSWRTCRPRRSSRNSVAIGASRDRTGQGRRSRESTASRTPGVSICAGARQRWRVRACRAFVLDAVSQDRCTTSRSRRDLATPGGPGGCRCTGPQSGRSLRGCHQDPVPPGGAFSRTRHASSRGHPCGLTLPCRRRPVTHFMRSAPEVAGG